MGCRPAVLIVPSYIKTVGVDPVDNRTSEYGLDTDLTASLIRNFQYDGRLGIENPDKADLRVKVTIRQYIEQPIYFDPKTNVVLQYQISVIYDLAALDTQENKTFMEDAQKNHSIIYYTPNYAGAVPETKPQAVARLEDELARLIVRRVLEGY